MAEGRVAQIVAHGDGLRQIFVEAQGPGDGLGDAGNLQGMGHPGAVVVPLRVQKHLGLVHQPAEGLAVDHPVRIPLVAGAHILLPFRLRSGAAGAPVGKSRQRIQPPVLQTLQFFPHGHCHHSLIFVRFSLWERCPQGGEGPLIRLRRQLPQRGSQDPAKSQILRAIPFLARLPERPGTPGRSPWPPRCRWSCPANG